MVRPNYIRVLVILTAMMAAALVAVLMSSGLALAQETGTTFTVNSTNDPGTGSCDTTECTLREAITAANDQSANPGKDTINISATGTINLQSRLPQLVTNMEVKGPGADTLTVRRDAAGGDFLIFKITNSDVTISGLTVANGKEAGDAGGISIVSSFGAANATLKGVTVSGNEASFFGGGIDNSGSSLTLIDSTVSGNLARIKGGGIVNRSTLTLVNSTVSGNSVTDPPSSGTNGGGIYNNGGATLTLDNSTLNGNSAPSGTDEGANLAGNFSFSDSVTFKNSIVANPQGGGVNCAGINITSTQGKNLEFPGTSCGFTGGIQNQDPLLGALNSNGGPTKTHALGEGSPAIDAADNASCTTTDQRGVGRPQDGDNNGTAVCDIGAFEKDGPPIVSSMTPPPRRSGNITVQFSESMDPGTLMQVLNNDPTQPSNSTTILLLYGDPTSTTQVPAKVSCTDASCKTLTIDPDARLGKRKTYTVRIEGAGDTDGLAVKDLAGNELAQDFTSSFKTRRR